MGLSAHSQKKLRKMKAKWRIDTPEDYEKRETEILKMLAKGKEFGINTKVRITAGEVKNFSLEVPKNTRPLTDRLKVTIFNILGPDIPKKDVLDLYAGSGSFGLEALSRGANSATFVDAAKDAQYCIEKNIQKTGFLTNTTVIKQKVEDFLGEKRNLDETYDIVFIDPPYKKFNKKNVKEIQNVLDSAKMVLPGFKKGNRKKFKGTIILKHPRRYPIENLELNNLKKVETINFGLNALSIYIVI